ncbi:MAG: NADH-quinone oxidoreductase subunit M [Deltaproteobacteria bacterium]|nr:NADH-quinone oxidoreductase subunit M [Deltaproteobacteria bacterium]
MGDLPVLSLLLLMPTAALGLIVILPRTSKLAIKVVSAVSALLTVLLAAEVWWLYDVDGPQYQLQQIVPWLADFGISYHLGVDGPAVLMTLLNALVFLTGTLSMWTLQERVKEYFAFMVTLVIGVFGVFVSLDIFFFFFFYELAVLPMYPLIAVWGSSNKEYAAMKLTLFLMAGSALLFVGLLALYWSSGLRTFDLVALGQHAFDRSFQVAIYPMIYVGFGILAGMFPLHSWSPTGHVAAPTAVSMLHAGVLMKLGAFGIFRIAITLLPEGAKAWADTFAILATVNIVYGAFVALRQTDFKFVIGFSSVSHMGIVLLGLNVLSADGLNGAVFQMFAHGAMTALFFSSVGFIYDQTHCRDIGRFGGLAKQIPIASAFFIIAGLSGMGVPGFASFWAELLVFVGAVRGYPLLGVFAIAGLVISALFMLRVYLRAFFGPPNPEWNQLKEVSAWGALPRAILVCVLLIFGFYPRLALRLIGPTTSLLLRRF